MRTCLHSALLLLLLLLPLSITQATVPEKPGTAPVFIETTIDNPKPWVGQEVLLTYTLFFRETAPGIEDQSKPEHPGLWVQEVDTESFINSTAVSVKGIRFRKAVIRQLRVVPMQNGRLSVANYQLKCFIPKTGDLSLDSRNDTETIITAPPAIIQARPLPIPIPAGFSGAVGSFSLSVSAEKSRIHTGEPLTLFITLSGKGNLDARPAMTISIPDGFRHERSAVPTIVTSGATAAHSSVTTKIALTAINAGSFSFRPVSLTFFNPGTERYDTIRSNEIAVMVTPAPLITSPVKPPSPSTAPDPEGDTDPSALFMAALSGLVLALIFGLHHRYLKQRSDTLLKPATPKKQGAPKSPAVPAPRTTAALKSPETLRGELYAAMKQLGITNPGGMTSKNLCRKLETLNVTKQTANEAGKLLASIDHALYTPGDASQAHLDSMNQNTARVITELLSRR